MVIGVMAAACVEQHESLMTQQDSTWANRRLPGVRCIVAISFSRRLTSCLPALPHPIPANSPRSPRVPSFYGPPIDAMEWERKVVYLAWIADVLPDRV
jgi:hypothetical protein